MTFQKRIALVLTLLASSVYLNAGELLHNPVLSAPAGQDLVISANLVGNDQDPRVRLYYRPRGKEIFRSVEMGGTPSDLKGVIPGQSVDVAGLDYYIEASTIRNGAKVVIGTSPASNPTLNPNQIVVRKDETGPDVTPLSPGDGATIDTSKPVIMAALNDADSGVDPKTVMIKIDGEAVDKADIQSFDTMASYVVTKSLTDGEHEIVVAVKDNAGNAGSAKWKVTVAASASSKLGTNDKKVWHWDGKASAQTEYGHSISQSLPNSALPYRPFGKNTGHLEVNGRSKNDDTVKLEVTKSDAERSDQQPVDRYVGTWKNRQGVIGLGDFSPSFSELSLYNLYQLRGVTLDLRSGPINEGHTRFVGVWGQTRRAIEADATGFAGASYPTFAQSLYGARWEFGSQYFQMGTNAVTVNDDKGSVTKSGSTSPYYNTLMTADMRIGLPFMFLSLNGEAGTDLYSDSSPLGLSVGSAYKAGLDWNIKPWSTRLTFDFKDLGGGYGLLPGGYTAVSNPGLIPDYRGYESSFTQGLFEGQFSFDLQLNRWRDNLQNLKNATTTTDYLSVGTSIAPQGYPNLFVAYSQNLQSNDADGNTGSTFVQPNLKTDNKFTTTNVSISYNKSFDVKTSGTLVLSLVHSDNMDQSYQRQTQDLISNNVVLNGFANFGPSNFNASVGYSANSQPGYQSTATGLTFSAAPKTSNSVTTSLRWGQQWQPSILDSYLGWDLNSGSAASDTYLSFIKTNSNTLRNTFKLGGGWAFADRQKLSTDFALAIVTSSSLDLTGTTTNDNLTQLYSGLKYELTF